MRHPKGKPPEILRAVGSLANELVNSASMKAEPAKIATALHHASTRYARALDLLPKECQTVLEQATDWSTPPAGKSST